MIDANNYLTALTRHNAALSESNAFNKEAVLDALSQAGISRVTVTFNGEGDSGQIEEISTAEDKSIAGVSVQTKHGPWGADKVETRETSLEDAIETLCYDFLEYEHGGWENNDGAYGEFTLNVQERTITLEFNGRFTDVFTTSHTF